ncbi:MAG: MarR family winged helix-turn-helix transcriptional regulator [Candidatus Bipolaricaulota bacterium]|nr:MarR family winged helix-turn-helix transcriptional regulator [Candidatus Bipolaricaulota bacterium]
MDNEHESIRYLLTLICKLSRNRSRILMAEVGIHCGQGIALRQLWRTDGVTQSELAHSLHVAPATVTIALQRMERVGLIERRPDKRDQRVSHVFLTDRGRSLRMKVEENWHKLEGQMLVGFSSKEREVMSEHLLRILANLDDVA